MSFGGIAPGSLRSRAVANEPVDTVAGFRLAAHRRWEDGMELVGLSGSETAAIYLMGYATELALKVAVFELLGISPSADL